MSWTFSRTDQPIHIQSLLPISLNLQRMKLWKKYIYGNISELNFYPLNQEILVMAGVFGNPILIVNSSTDSPASPDLRRLYSL